ncbi:MAG: S9 family peptidase [Rhodanobacteraceae bacterium]|nr:S9 family peptidase [Rhodanobacteraceae bacterium]
MRLTAHLGSILLLCFLIGATALGAVADTDTPLSEGEGWIAVIVDNSAHISSLRLDGPGLLGDDLVKNLGDGRNVRVVRAKAGKYRWSMMTRRDGYLSLKRDAQFEFTVEAGKLNYPGNFVVESVGFNSVRYYRSNRASQTMMGLDLAFKGLREKYPWRNDLPSPDPFTEFAGSKLTVERSAPLLESADVDAKKWRERTVDEKFTEIFNDLYARPRMLWPAISPDGAMLAFKDHRNGLEVAIVVDLASGESREVASVPGVIDQLSWGGDRVLYVGLAVDMSQVLARLDSTDSRRVVVPSGASGLKLVRFSEGAFGADLNTLFLPGEVWVANPLPDDPRRGLVARRDSSGELHLFAFDEMARRFDIKDFRSERRLDKDVDRAFAFFPDSAGELRAALVADKNGSRALAVRGDDGKWLVHAALPENTVLTPVQLSADARALIVLTDHARDQIEMAELSLADGTIGKTLLAEPGADFSGALLSRRDRRVIGAQFYRNGTLQTRFVAGEGDNSLAALAKQFPDADLHLIDDTRDGKKLVVLVQSESDRGSFYLYDRTQRRLEKLADVFDPLKRAVPVGSKAFTVKADDGLSIESFISLPAGSAAAPLIVMPHGGPIGVSDRRKFDPVLQMLVNSGFAVLRVNYRGSGGAGRAFAQAGEGQWGREIEADVDRALAHALANYPLDRSRVALWGSSYGGYSTLMGLIQKPAQYRCGVAVAAVTDLPLMFSSSDWIRAPESVARMKKIIGDPDHAMSQLRDYSPVYQYERLTKPVLLIHGMADTRVSFEHSWRLRSLLAAAGRPPAWLPLPGADHSLSRTEDRLAMHAASDAFLRECLAPAVAP